MSAAPTLCPQRGQALPESLTRCLSGPAIQPARRVYITIAASRRAAQRLATAMALGLVPDLYPTADAAGRVLDTYPLPERVRLAVRAVTLPLGDEAEDRA